MYVSHVLEFLRRYGAMTMTSLSLISHVCETRKFVMAILHGKQGLLCDKTHSLYVVVYLFPVKFSKENF